eukprot:scaffold6254_cov376-Prasinococcus_capsulatus_cf.AAC.5
MRRTSVPLHDAAVYVVSCPTAPEVGGAVVVRGAALAAANARTGAQRAVHRAHAPSGLLVVGRTAAHGLGGRRHVSGHVSSPRHRGAVAVRQQQQRRSSCGGGTARAMAPRRVDGRRGLVAFRAAVAIAARASMRSARRPRVRPAATSDAQRPIAAIPRPVAGPCDVDATHCSHPTPPPRGKKPPLKRGGQ